MGSGELTVAEFCALFNSLHRNDATPNILSAIDTTMPPKKTVKTASRRKVEEEDHEALQQFDVKYNPDIVANMLSDLKANVDSRCEMLRSETEFQITSMQQAFHLELIRLPNNVKQMSMKQFRDEFNFSLEAVTRSVMLGGNSISSKTAGNRSVFETPAHNRKAAPLSVLQTPAPSTAIRNPREGEVILSANGSPLGEFQTVVKAPRANNNNIIPPTPGVFVPLKSGEVVDLDALDIENMPTETKLDTLQQMEMMMQNMKQMMERLQGSGV